MVRPRRASYRYKKRSYSRPKSIKRAWNMKKRRKVSLNDRTTMANRRAIKSIRKSVESKMCENVLCTTATDYGGQFVTDTVDAAGDNAAGLPFSMRLWAGLTTGDDSNDRTGAWVNHKSTTLKIKLEPGAGIAPDSYNKVTFYLVLDKSPMESDNVTVSVPTLGELLAGSSGDNSLKYYNLNNTGLKSRFKILKKFVLNTSPATPNIGRLFSPIKFKTITVKGNYKIKYAERAGSIEPLNQSLILMAHSDSAVIPMPRLNVFCRFRFRETA